MSFVTLLTWKLQNIDTMYRSQATMMNNSQRLMDMASNPLKYSPQQAVNMEKQLMFGSLTASTMNKIADAQQDGIDKMLDADIKRSFSYMA